MKRLYVVALFVLGFTAAGAFSGAVIADVTTSSSTTTGTTATTTTATTTTTTTTTVSTIPAGVRVAGVRVGGLRPSDAVSAVHDAFAKPLAVVVDRSRLALDPVKFASVYIETAVARARVSTAGTNVDLVVAVRGAPLRAWVAGVEKRFARAPVDATLKLKNGKPFLTKDKAGRRLDTTRLTERIVAALRANTRLPVRVRTKPVAPKVSVGTYAKVIVINRSINRLYLYKGNKLSRTFPVATGQAIYPTPRGTWHIVVKYRNPWWYPPTSSPWARGLKPVPPGPNNPLGTRWMGLDAPGVGIHGTDAPSSIGYSASHGCVRMQVPDAEWLFDHVDIGTTVFVL
ncbi:MAG TPA: L,D-transpeptidase family protein [Gaiellaceae bacterium]|nr:L,D-transpeptidase family protein [Gaiellaceae bacterium]